MTALATDWQNIVLQEPPPLHDIGPFRPEDVFFGKPRSEAAFGGDVGLAQGPSFTPEELTRIQDLIHDHLVTNARGLSAFAADAIANVPLKDYHRVADASIHGGLLSKAGRIMTKHAVDEIRQMSFFDYVRKAFGPFYLSDEEELGHEQICLRVVRPNRREDVGSLHRDSWFWDHFGFHVPDGVCRTKVWTAICGTPGKAGLLVGVGSHRAPGGFKAEMQAGKLAFIPQVAQQDVNLHRFMGAMGDPIMFNYNTLHVGALTRGDETRVSFEITIMYNKQSQ